MPRIAVGSALRVAMLLVASMAAQAQLPAGVQRSSSPQGYRVQGNTASGPSVTGAHAPAAVKEGGVAAQSAAAGKRGAQIQGNVRINATAANTDAVAVGQGNKAQNQLGSIGGK